MDTPQIRIFHMVKSVSTHEIHCVPESWIRVQDSESTLVLLAFPNEPWRITQERVKNYEAPGGDWTLHLAQIIYNTNFYPSVIRCPRGKCDKGGICTDSESSDSSILRSLLLSNEMGRSSDHQLEFYRWLRGQSNSDDSGLSIDSISIQSERSGNQMNQDIDSEYDVPLDLSRNSRKSDQSLTSQDQKQNVNILYLTTRDFTDKSWTLKHRVYSPGLVELLPNTGVYIEEAKLHRCLRSSRNCCALARLLTKSIFSDTALKKCRYLGKNQGDLKNRLSPNATAAIVDFVRMHGDHHNWSISTVEDIKRAMRYQLKMYKRNN